MSEIEILIICKQPRKRSGFKYIPLNQFILSETEGKAEITKAKKQQRRGDSA